MNAERKNLLRATATPLASIFGSGFLIIVPILAITVGSLSALAVVAVFGVHDIVLLQRDGIILPPDPQISAWEMATVLAGTLIVVQGFETSRYLGESFDPDTRIRSSRLSQKGICVLLPVAMPGSVKCGGKDHAPHLH